jgi:hypothetical protein
MPPGATSHGLRVAVRYPDGRSETLMVDSDRVLVGSGAHCEIRLPPEYAQGEHIELALSGESVHATARALEPLPTINGSGFLQTPVAPDAVLGVGQAQLWVTPAVIEENPNVIRKKAQPTSPLAYLGALLMIPLAGYILFYDEAPDTQPAAPTEVPALWSAPITQCPVAPTEALAFALEKKVVAEGKRERRPFHVQDGVAAVPLFETAGACLRVANDPRAQDATDAAKQLRAKIEEDYRAHQVRLEHALSVSDFATAQKEVAVLRALTEGRSGPYVVWLSNLDRRLQLKLGAPARGGAS